VAVSPFVSLDGEYNYEDRTEQLSAHRARGRLTIRF
jgi:hypothetical protein